ncbi:translesion error-prone DNA polymerase V autoproteolytic subunit [Pasteurellaceae bacterium 20609_3]|uniref:translesion error-prone DNA polymerase V autoproteolytic subunit n=1 Tax=Spirabiliibacterium mucosae TaxID=28156 RepID=UPI001AAC9A7E|nr:translesion error-prone DNA polymerase V autoproteolytic subunit [Spirabiliibacterium mucosae]MBE2898684.1 translesion error-prone DNA polymerase V autoproteolytic subunit [Spirabiliibacterium mucosae]
MYRARIHQTLRIPFVLAHVKAGFPSPAEDYIERYLDLNELCISHPDATYFVRAQGESMVEAGIFDDDVLVVDRARQAQHGDIVIACVAGEFTVKKLNLKTTPIQLEPMNPSGRYKPLPVESELMIFGVVTHAIHPLR